MITSKDCYAQERCKKYRDGTCPSDDFCQRLFRLDYLYNESNLSQQQRKHIDLVIDSDGTDEKEFTFLSDIQKNIVNFVNEGKNLYIHSINCGCGKSSWSVRMIQAYFNSIWSTCELECKAMYINVPRLVLALKDNISKTNDYVEHIKENVFTADLVVWDEIGVKTLTQFEYDNLLQMINTRIDLGKSNIYTSNATPEEIRQKMGDRLYSRICNGAIDIEFHGKDKRNLCKVGDLS